MTRAERPSASRVLAAAFVAGAIPFSGLAARLAAGFDLRRVGTGIVSGTGPYQVAGFGPLAVAGSLDVAKGAPGPLLAGPDRPWLGVAATAVCGHNWSPFLRGAGGRGISPAMGALGVVAPEGSAVLLAGLAAGRLLHHTGLAGLAALALLVPVLGSRHGSRGVVSALAVAVPMVVKRILGDAPRAPGAWRSRLLFDRDAVEKPAASGGERGLGGGGERGLGGGGGTELGG